MTKFEVGDLVKNVNPSHYFYNEIGIVLPSRGPLILIFSFTNQEIAFIHPLSLNHI